MRRVLFILALALLLASCATTEVDIEASAETVVESIEQISATRAQEASSWVNTPSSKSVSNEEWDALFNKPVEVAEEPEVLSGPVEEVVEETTKVVAEVPVEPVIEELEAVSEAGQDFQAEESPVETTAISIAEPAEIKEQGEPSAEVLEPEPEEEFIVEQEEEIVLPEVEYEFAGEDYRDASFILEPEEEIIITSPEVETVVVETGIEPEEKVNPNIIAEIAEEYKELEKTDMAKPSFKDRAVSFLKKNLLCLELIAIAILVVFIVVIFTKRTKKAKKARKEGVKPEEDEGEEIDMTPSYYVSPNAEAEREDVQAAGAGLERSREEESGSEVKASPNEAGGEYGSENESYYEPEDESGYDSEDESEVEEDPGGYDDGF